MAGIFIYLTALIALVAIGIGYYQQHESDQTTKRISDWGNQHELKLAETQFKRDEFKIEFNEAEWTALVKKLDSTRYFDRIEDAPDFSFGFNPDYARELVTYWRTSFDWRKQIQRLNKYTQYRASVNNTLIHYIYHETNRGIKSTQPPVNLMLIDGWPGCSFSFHRMIEEIENQFKDVRFRIFVPSIPGYGYSTPLNRVVTSTDTALLFDALMRFEKADNYFVHAEDWGSLVATTLAQLFPNRVRGIHGSLLAQPSSLFDIIQVIVGKIFPSSFYSEAEIELNFPQRFSLTNMLSVFWTSLGYFHLQSTKPDTVAHGLTDSPVGLLAYILEKYSSWTFDYEKEIIGHRDGGLEKLNKDQLLSIVTIYWMTNSISSSVRFYKINIDNQFSSTSFNRDMFSARIPAEVRVGVQMMNHEILITPEKVVQMRFRNLTQYRILSGGHFAAFEKPVKTAANFVQFVLNSL